jgi:hypothetical protein
MTYTTSSASTSNTERELIGVHAESYHRFMLGLKWTVFTLASLIVWLTVWFATPAGFLSGLIAGALVLIVGAYAMRHGLAHSTEQDNPGALEPDRG